MHKNSDDPKGEGLAKKAAEYNCEAVITGKLTPEAFDILADRYITRYNGCSCYVREVY